MVVRACGVPLVNALSVWVRACIASICILMWLRCPAALNSEQRACCRRARLCGLVAGAYSLLVQMQMQAAAVEGEGEEGDAADGIDSDEEVAALAAAATAPPANGSAVGAAAARAVSTGSAAAAAGGGAVPAVSIASSTAAAAAARGASIELAGRRNSATGGRVSGELVLGGDSLTGGAHQDGSLVGMTARGRFIVAPQCTTHCPGLVAPLPTPLPHPRPHLNTNVCPIANWL